MLVLLIQFVCAALTSSSWDLRGSLMCFRLEIDRCFASSQGSAEVVPLNTQKNPGLEAILETQILRLVY